MEWLIGILGFIIGSIFGVVFMCLFQINGKNSEDPQQ